VVSLRPERVKYKEYGKYDKREKKREADRGRYGCRDREVFTIIAE
jgi:hypothetical protein